MNKSTYLGNQICKFIFHNVLPEFKDVTEYFISLHDEDPSLGEDQTYGELNYEGYKRSKVIRDDKSWLLVGNTVTNLEPHTFGICVEGTYKAKYAAIGLTEIDKGNVLYSGKLLKTIEITANRIPIIPPKNATLVER